MLFNSTVFLQFFAAFLLLYWFCRGNLTARNVLIVVSSYLFYGWWQPVEGEWDLRFLGLLFASSTFDFGVGLALSRLKQPRQRRALLIASMLVNLGILGFFKYCNFFIETFSAAAARLGLDIAPSTFAIILPVGISFYTFQSMSYAIDVYRGTIPATRNYLNFLAFVSFFPQLVAGPIERASHLLPQFERTRVINRPMIEEGFWLLVWGMFKKVVLADNLAPLVEMVFDHPTTSGPAVVLATIAFGLQIYCDFSGYSDIARGLARLLGFDIMWNFQLPYLATDVREFWRRWHISLSTWLRDYLYISLGGNRHGAARTYFNLIATMLLGGLWHGAAWNFVLWGCWHGLGLAAHRAFNGNRDSSREPVTGLRSALTPALSPGERVEHQSILQAPRSDRAEEAHLTIKHPAPDGPKFPCSDPGHDVPPSPTILAGEGRGDGHAPDHFLRNRTSAAPKQLRPRAGKALAWLGTMAFVYYGWLLFRAKSLDHVLTLTASLTNLSAPPWLGSFALCLVIYGSPLLLMELWQRRTNNLLAPLQLRPSLRLALQGLLILLVAFHWSREHSSFIYFQF